MAIIDMQVHAWRPLEPGEQWDPILPPHHGEALTAVRLITTMDEAGVDRAVIVTPAFVGFNDRYCLDAADKWPNRFGVMGRPDPTAKGAKEQLASWFDHPGMVGLRYAMPFEPWRSWLGSGALDWSWPILEKAGIPTALYAPGLTRQFEPIAARYPGLKLIVDHLNLPMPQDGVPDPFADLGDLLGLAKYPNVYVKVSALPLYATEPYPFRNLHPYIRRVYDAFGPQRMTWGSDLSRLKCPYRQVVDLIAEACDFLTEEDRAWILGRTAAQLLRWTTPFV